MLLLYFVHIHNEKAGQLSGTQLRLRGQVFCLIALTTIAGCSPSPSYAALAKVARSVPTPPGLTYAREVDHTTRTAIGNAKQREVDLYYSAAGISCSQLRSAWQDAIAKVGWHIDSANPGDALAVFYLKKDGVLITIDPAGSTGTCTEPRVAAFKP